MGATSTRLQGISKMTQLNRGSCNNKKWVYLDEKDDDPDPLTQVTSELKNLKVLKDTPVKKKALHETEVPSSRTLAQKTPKQRPTKTLKGKEEPVVVIDLTEDSEEEPVILADSPTPARTDEDAPIFHSSTLTKALLQRLDKETVSDDWNLGHVKEVLKTQQSRTQSRSQTKDSRRRLPDSPLLYLNNIPISIALIQRLRQPSSWLNDEIINSYLCLLSARLPNILFFNTFFHTQLTQGGFERVRSWTRKFEMGAFGFKRVVIPINKGNYHWALACIDMEDYSIGYYDSMGSGASSFRARLTKDLGDYLLLEYEDKVRGQCEHSKDEFSPEELQDRLHGIKSVAPQQADGGSCGVFLCLMAKRLAEGKVLDFDQSDVDQFRDKMALDLLSPLLMPGLDVSQDVKEVGE